MKGSQLVEIVSLESRKHFRSPLPATILRKGDLLCGELVAGFGQFSDSA